MSSRSKPFVAGILGGIGSGKSAVARSLGQHFNAPVIDADQIGHEVLTFPAVQDRIRESFGDAVFSGVEVNRRALAREVFGPEMEKQRALKVLEGIVHPEIGRLIDARIQEVENQRLVLVDAAVMLEAGWRQHCDLLVFVDVPFDVRLKRIQSRGWSEEELRRREASQLSLDEKRRAADFVVDNSGKLETTVQTVASLLQSRMSLNESEESSGSSHP